MLVGVIGNTTDFDSVILGSSPKPVTNNIFMSVNFNSTRCSYCERRFTETNYRTKEHIVPLSKGGNNYFENLVWICNECNNFRGNKDLPYFYNQINNILNNNRTIKIKIYTYNRQDLQNMVKNLSYYKTKELMISYER